MWTSRRSLVSSTHVHTPYQVASVRDHEGSTKPACTIHKTNRARWISLATVWASHLLQRCLHPSPDICLILIALFLIGRRLLGRLCNRWDAMSFEKSTSNIVDFSRLHKLAPLFLYEGKTYRPFQVSLLIPINLGLRGIDFLIAAYSLIGLHPNYMRCDCS